MDEEREIQQAWEQGTPVEVRRERPSTSVLSIRVSQEVLEALGRRAREKDVAPSQLAREILESSLTSEEPRTPIELADALSRWLRDWPHRRVSIGGASQPFLATCWLYTGVATTSDWGPRYQQVVGGPGAPYVRDSKAESEKQSSSEKVA